MQSSPFPLTEGILARMLGVRRVGVIQATRALLLTSYSRGIITIFERKDLEAASICVLYVR